MTAEEYEKDLEENLRSLLERFKSGSYYAPAVKRVYIPKGDGKKRPIGIPALEDKILQRAVVMVLQPLYEVDFLDVSFGFRPGRSVHDALEALRKAAMRLIFNTHLPAHLLDDLAHDRQTQAMPGGAHGRQLWVGLDSNSLRHAPIGILYAFL